MRSREAVTPQQELIRWGHMVKGVEFVIDDSGEKKAVLIDLKRHGEVCEDLYDILRAKERESEPRGSLSDIRQKVLGQH